MIIRVIIFCLVGILYSKDYTVNIKIFSLEDDSLKNKLEDVSYTLIDIDNKKIIESRKNIKLKAKKSNKYKIKYDFSSANIDIIINCTEKNKRYEKKIEIDKTWFTTKHTQRQKNISWDIEQRDDKDIEFENNGYYYPYKFKFNLNAKKPVVRGFVYHMEDGYEVPIQGAIVKFNELNVPGSKSTEKDGTFIWEVNYADPQKIISDPEIYATKIDFHINSERFKKKFFQEADTTDIIKIRLDKKEKYTFKSNCGYYSKILEYNEDCNECICKDKSNVFYPRYGVCDIPTCSDLTKPIKTWLNRSSESSTIILGDMYIECVEKIGINKNLQDVLESDLESTVKLASFTVEGNVDQLKILYPENHNPDQRIDELTTVSSDSLIGTIDLSKKLMISDSYHSFDSKAYHKRHIDQIISDMEWDINSNNYFFIKKIKPTKMRHEFIVEYNHKRYPLRVNSQEKTNKGEKISINELQYLNIKIKYDEESDRFDVISVDSYHDTHSSTNSTNNNSSSNQNQSEFNEVYNQLQKHNEFCNEQYKKLDDSIEKCDWNDAKLISYDIIKSECDFTSDLNTMSKIMKSLYNNAIEYNDSKFLRSFSENSYRTNPMGYPTIFEQLDALYIRYDEIKLLPSLGFSDYSGTAVALHYYRKYSFYLSYCEFLLGGLQDIFATGRNRILSDGNIWMDQLYHHPTIFEYKSTQKPFHSEEGVNKKTFINHIKEQADRASKQYKKAEANAIKEENFEGASIKSMELRLKIIINNQY